jgi:hypothetical protein
MQTGNAIFVVGPSGSGKSSFVRDALIELGSGLVVMAPGADEEASYSALLDEPSYDIEGFNEPKAMRKFLTEAYRLNQANVKEHGQPLHRLVALDTASGCDQIIRHAKLKAMGQEVPPKARSTDGAEFYQGIQYEWERILQIMRAMRGIGMHWVVLCHSKMKTVDGTSAVGDGLDATEQIVPQITGSTGRTIIASFDLVLHSGVKRIGKEVKHVLQWRSDPDKVTKSRFGDLADGRFLPNTWNRVVECVDEARSQRKAEFRARRAEINKGVHDGSS